MTAFEVAEFIGSHEETIRRAYLRGLLTSQRFGVRGRRFHPADVLDWIKRERQRECRKRKEKGYGRTDDLQAERVSREPAMQSPLVPATEGGRRVEASRRETIGDHLVAQRIVSHLSPQSSACD